MKAWNLLLFAPLFFFSPFLHTRQHNVESISNVWHLYTPKGLTSALDVNALIWHLVGNIGGWWTLGLSGLWPLNDSKSPWHAMPSEFYILYALFDLKSGIQIVKYKARFIAFSKIQVRDDTLQIISWKWYILVYAGIISVDSNTVVWM